MKAKLRMTLPILAAFFVFGLAESVQAAPAVYSVFASGDVSGVTDRVNIQAAIDQAKYAGPKAKVVLGTGTFYTDGPLELISSCISFRGRGNGQTVITNAPGVVFGTQLFEPIIRISLDNSWDPDIVCDVEVADMTIWASGPTGYEFDGYDASVDGIWITGKPLGGPAGMSRYKADFHGLEFRGQIGDNYWFSSSMRVGIEALHESFTEWLLSLDMTVSNCQFSDVAIAVDQWMLIDSHVVIQGNYIENTALASMELGDSSNSLIEAIDNDIVGSGRLIAWNGWTWAIPEVGEIPQLSTYIISNNRIHSIGVLALDIRDLANFNSSIPGSTVTMTALVTRNLLNAQDNPFPLAGAMLALAVDDSLFSFNTIIGNTLADWPQPGHVGIGSPMVFTGDRNRIFRNDASAFVNNPESPFDVLLWNDARTDVNGVAEDNIVFNSGPVLDETDDPSTPEYDGFNTIFP